MAELPAFLLALEDAFNAAMTSNDVGRIARFVSDDWVLVTPEAGPVPRARLFDAIRSGRLTPLALVADKRSPLLPGVPTLGEAGVTDAPTDAWMALAGPRGLPDAVVRRLSQALESAVSQAEFRQLMAAGGGEASWSSPEALQALWVGDRRRWAAVVRTNGIRAD